MKNFKWIAAAVVFIAFAKANTIQAQEFKAIAHFIAQTKFDIKEDTTTSKKEEVSQDPRMAELMVKFKKQLTEGTKQEYVMEFTATESAYDKVQELAKPTQPGKMSINLGSPNSGSTSRVYKDIKEQKYYKEDQIFGKEFLIIDDFKTYNWQTTNETKKIGNYTCYKATYLPELTESEKEAAAEKEESAKNGSILALTPDKDRTITAWWTPEIPVSNGPGEYQGLPGLILEVKEQNTILLCTKIEINPIEKLSIKKPKSGKEINQKDFDALKKQKMEEQMKKQGNKGFIIETRSF